LLDNIKNSDEIVLLADLKGGSPYTSAATLLSEKGMLEKSVIISGLNLPLILTVLFEKNKLEENGRIKEVTASRLRRIEHHISNKNDELINTPITRIQTSGSIDMDYFLFESKYRGSRDEIKERQKVYLDYFKERQHVLDIGCGKGEFVELLAENNIGVSGIDIDKDNVIYCIDKGLPVKLAEALEYLQSCEDSSLDGIFMAQVAEHLKPNDLITLIRLARRKLQAGAYFIAKTINPQSLIVFTESYYMDPSHIKMVHPLTINFIFETEGFLNIEFKFLSPVADDMKIPRLECMEDCKNIDDFNNAISKLNDLVYGCRDYAIIAKR
jgi:O-antigen chain-terminating methyltransferase